MDRWRGIVNTRLIRDQPGRPELPTASKYTPQRASPSSSPGSGRGADDSALHAVQNERNHGTGKI